MAAALVRSAMIHWIRNSICLADRVLERTWFAFRWVVEMMGESGKIGLFAVGYRYPVRPLTVVTLVELNTASDRVFFTFVKGRVETVNADGT